MKKLFILFILITSFNVFSASNDKLLCSYVRGKAFEKELRQYGGTDKFMHCTMSCYLAGRCGASESAITGFLKEVLDFFGPGNAEIADLKANAEGIKVGTPLFYSNRSGEDIKKICLRRCEAIYP